VVTEEEAIVGGIHHDGVVGQALPLEVVQHPAEIVVDRGDGAQIVFDVALVLPPDVLLVPEIRLSKRFVLRIVRGGPQGTLGVGQSGHWGELEMAVGEVVRHRHFRRGGGRRPAGIVVEQGRGLRNRHVIVQREMIGARIPVRMRSFVLIHQQKGPIPIATIEPPQGPVGDDVGDIPVVLDAVGCRGERRVVVLTLAVQHLVMIEAGRPGLQVPFADDRGLVARLLQQLGERHAVGIQRLPKRDNAVDVPVLPREHRRPARSTERVGHECVGEADALRGQPIDIGRLVDS